MEEGKGRLKTINKKQNYEKTKPKRSTFKKYFLFSQ